MAIDDCELDIWEKYTPILYEFLVSCALGCPSLTVQWLPDREEPAKDDYSVQKLIIGTNWPGKLPNYLLLIEASVPLRDVEVDPEEYQLYQNGDIGEIDELYGKVQKVQQISHVDVVYRARHMPQNKSIIATKTDSGKMFLFDCSRHPSDTPVDDAFNPDLRLTGQKFQGVGLSWSPIEEGRLLANGTDGLISLWDCKAAPENKSLDPVHVFQATPNMVEDVAWHLKYASVFGSVGEKFLHIWDLRNPGTSLINSVAAHNDTVYCLAFSPFNEWIAATGSADETVKLFDIRKIDTALHTFYPMAGGVCQLGWRPKGETILASSCTSGRIFVWDLTRGVNVEVTIDCRIGDEQTPSEGADGPPELLFIHGGHTGYIHDFSWNPCDDWAIASVDAADGLIQIWKMAEHIHKDEDDEHPDDPTADAP